MQVVLRMVKDRDAYKINNSYESEPTTSNGVSFSTFFFAKFSHSRFYNFVSINSICLVVERCTVQRMGFGFPVRTSATERLFVSECGSI